MLGYISRMIEQDGNPLAELEALYLDGDWDRAFRRAGNSGRAALDLLRVVLVMAGDLRAIRNVVESGGEFPPRRDLRAKGPGGK